MQLNMNTTNVTNVKRENLIFAKVKVTASYSPVNTNKLVGCCFCCTSLANNFAAASARFR